jgi:hypothetical protein
MNRELMLKTFSLLTAYREFTGDSRIANMCSEVIDAIDAELAKPEPVVSFTDNEEGLWVQLQCNGAYYSQNLSESKTAKFFVDAYRRLK